MVAELWRRTVTALAVGEAVGKALNEFVCALLKNGN